MDLSNLDIRYTQQTDIYFLQQWAKDPNVLRWLPMKTEKEIDDALHAWISFARYSCSLTAFLQNTPLGIATLFLMPYRKVAHHCLFKIIVNPPYQRQGVGEALIKNLKNLAKSYFYLESLLIEVFEGNPIISLLKKLDFQESLRQEKYIKDEGQYFARIVYEAML